MSTAINIDVEREAFRLLGYRDGGAAVGLMRLAEALEVEIAEVARFIAEPSSMLAFTRMRLANLLEEEATNTRDAEWATLIAGALRDSGVRLLQVNPQPGQQLQ